MAINNSLYVPISDAAGKDFVQVSGYCYKKIAESVIIPDGVIATRTIYGSFDDCLDCNSCVCGKDIDFIVGGFKYVDGTPSFHESKITIQTYSTGWQEIAIESGFLNQNDPSINFKPTQISCFDRKIDMQSGIHASFEDRGAEIAYFKYVVESDLYERQELKSFAATGGFVTEPDFSYTNLYDEVKIANKINTIKFYNNCDFDCGTQDITFRIRGDIYETADLLNLGNEYDGKTSSWIYATCTGLPVTPGQIVECMPSGTGFNFTDYFLDGYDVNIPATYKVSLSPRSIDVVNMPILMGEAGSDLSKEYSVTGSGHFKDLINQFTTSYTTPMDNFYYGTDGVDTDFDYSEDIGKKHGIRYNRPTGCFDSSIIDSDFNVFYRHLGGNTFAEVGALGVNIGDIYTGCYQASEFADGLFKNGTYSPMSFSGMVTGTNEEYSTFISSTLPPQDFSTGVFVYQWYKSGDKSSVNNLTGYYGLMTGQYMDEEIHNHYRSIVENSGPINMGNPLKYWNIKSGNFPINTATPEFFNVIADFNSAENYEFGFNGSGFKFRHQDGVDEFDLDRFENYGLTAAGTNSMVDLINQPSAPTNTFVEPFDIRPAFPLTDSGNALHIDDTLIVKTLAEDPTDIDQAFELKSLTFQLSWKK